MSPSARQFLPSHQGLSSLVIDDDNEPTHLHPAAARDPLPRSPSSVAPVALDARSEELEPPPSPAPRVLRSVLWRSVGVAIGIGLGCFYGAPGRGDVATRAAAQLIEPPVLAETFVEPFGERPPIPAATAPIVMTDKPPVLRARDTRDSRGSARRSAKIRGARK